MSGFGNFRNRKTDVRNITELDLQNPWNFFTLFQSDDKYVLKWLRDHNLIAPPQIQCPKCDCEGSWRPRSGGHHKLGGVYVCSNKHATTTLHNRFFQRVKIAVRDVMLFMKLYLEGMTLRKICAQVGVNYSSTAVNWGSMIREVMVDKIYRCLPTMRLCGDVEIDESLFGRKMKHHRGAVRGTRVWIFGMVERSSNTLIMYPVESRSKEVLLPLIKKHVLPGSRILSDGWSAYLSLNNEGYEHFVVNHKMSFTQKYENVDTGNIITVHTNTVEGAWKHAKAHFKEMNGVRGLANFESHLCEVMYRHMYRGDYLLACYLQDLRTIYPLDTAPMYTYVAPIFTTLPSGEEYKRTRVESAIETHDSLSDNDGDLSDPFQDTDEPIAGPSNVHAVDAIQVSDTVSSSEEDGGEHTGTLTKDTSAPTPDIIDLTTSEDDTRKGRGKQAMTEKTKKKDKAKGGNEKGARPKYRRGLACPPDWKPKDASKHFHVTRTFEDSDDDFL